MTRHWHSERDLLLPLKLKLVEEEIVMWRLGLLLHCCHWKEFFLEKKAMMLIQAFSLLFDHSSLPSFSCLSFTPLL